MNKEHLYSTANYKYLFVSQATIHTICFYTQDIRYLRAHGCCLSCYIFEDCMQIIGEKQNILKPWHNVNIESNQSSEQKDLKLHLERQMDEQTLFNFLGQGKNPKFPVSLYFHTYTDDGLFRLGQVS